MSKGHSTFLEYRIYRKKFLGTIIVVIVLCLSAFSGVLFFFIRNWVNDVQIQSQYRFQQKERSWKMFRPGHGPMWKACTPMRR